MDHLIQPWYTTNPVSVIVVFVFLSTRTPSYISIKILETCYKHILTLRRVSLTNRNNNKLYEQIYIFFRSNKTFLILILILIHLTFLKSAKYNCWDSEQCRGYKESILHSAI